MSAYDDLLAAMQMIRDSRPTLLVAPVDLERIREAPGAARFNVEASSFVEPDQAIFMTSLNDQMTALGMKPREGTR